MNILRSSKNNRRRRADLLFYCRALCYASLTLYLFSPAHSLCKESQASDDQRDQVRIKSLLSRAHEECGAPSLTREESSQWVVALHYVSIRRDQVKLSVIYRAQGGRHKTKAKQVDIHSLPRLIAPTRSEALKRSLVVINDDFYLLEEWSSQRPSLELIHRVSHSHYTVELILFDIDISLLQSTKGELFSRGRAPSLPHLSKEANHKSNGIVRFKLICGQEIAPEPTSASSVIIWRP